MGEGLRAKPRDERDTTIAQLQRKLRGVTMAYELLEAEIDTLEAGLPLARRWSRS